MTRKINGWVAMGVLAAVTVGAQEGTKAGSAGPGAPDPSSRKARVVVVPAAYAQSERSRFARELLEKWGVSELGVVENPGYTAFLVDALVNSRRFDVLEREALRTSVKEIDFGASDYGDVAKVVKIGGMLNADYVVVPEIRRLIVAGEDKEIPYVGQKIRTLKGTLAVNVRTVDVKTSRIVSSAMAEIGITNVVREWPKDLVSPLSRLVEAMYRESALREAARIADAAYPIRIVAVEGNAATLNRGTGSVREGDLLDVYRAGEPLEDPDTKESLGTREALVGRVKVTKVDDRTCTAEIVEGDGAVQKMDLCRRIARTTDTQDAAKKD